WKPGWGARPPESRAGAARSPARFDIRRIEAVEQVPEDLGLADECVHAAHLQLVGGGVLDDEVDRFQRVLARAWRPRAEVLQRVLADPGVVLLPRQHALGHEVGREELGE